MCGYGISLGIRSCDHNVTRDCIVVYRSAESTCMLFLHSYFWFLLIVVCFVVQYIFGTIVLYLVFGTVTCMLIHSHNSPVLRDPATETADGDFIVRAPSFPSSTIIRIWVATERAH